MYMSSYLIQFDAADESYKPALIAKAQKLSEEFKVEMKLSYNGSAISFGDADFRDAVAAELTAYLETLK